MYLGKSTRVFQGAFQDFKHDLKLTRWLRGRAWTAGVIWILGLIISLIISLSISLIITSPFALFTSDTNACQPDGSFRLYPETYSPWGSSGFFQITLGGGKLSFAQTKVVEIVWDIVS